MKSSLNKIAILLILIFVCFWPSKSQPTALNLATDFPYNGNILSSARVLYYQVATSTVPPNNFVSIRFQVTTPSVITSLFLAVSHDQSKYTLQNTPISRLYSKNYTELDGEIDIGSLKLGKTQYINRRKIGSGVDDIFYLTVFYFDPEYRKADLSFTISVDIVSAPASPPCYNCLHGSGRLYPGTANCVCGRCIPGFYGPDCSINMLTLTNGQPTSTIVNGPGMAFFMINQPGDINILVKQSVGIGQIYFQFVNFDGDFAAFTNVAQGRSLQGRFLSTAGTAGASFGAVSSGARMSITVAIYGSYATSVQVTYSTPQKSNVLLIVLSVVGGVLFIGLVIAGIYIVRNSRWFNGGQQNRQIRPASQDLNDDQIQRFFPTIMLKSINYNNPQQQSSVKLNQNQSSEKQKQKINVEDCVICLCPIQLQENIKVTYCKHVFHSQCLIGWFKKQQVIFFYMKNCPYCREEFTRTNTIKLYKKVKQSINGGILKGEDLVNAIFQHKQSLIVSKDSLEGFDESDIKKINPQLRNSFEISNLS